MIHPIFVLYVAHEVSPPEPCFAFHASSLAKAKSMMIGWTRYHSFDPRDYSVEENPNYRELGIGMHDEYVEHDGRTRFLAFFGHQSLDTKRSLLIESHAFTGRIPAPSYIRDLLAEVARVHFGNTPFEIRDDLPSPSPMELPLYDYLADAEDGRVIVPAKI